MWRTNGDGTRIVVRVQGSSGVEPVVEHEKVVVDKCVVGVDLVGDGVHDGEEAEAGRLEQHLSAGERGQWSALACILTSNMENSRPNRRWAEWSVGTEWSMAYKPRLVPMKLSV